MQGDQSVYLLSGNLETREIVNETPNTISAAHIVDEHNVQKLETQVKALFASIHNQQTQTFCFQLY